MATQARPRSRRPYDGMVGEIVMMPADEDATRTYVSGEVRTRPSPGTDERTDPADDDPPSE